jgi:asparagine synthase (glutamine-hydrolysing)
MSSLFGWLPRRPDERAIVIVETMRDALVRGGHATAGAWPISGGAIGALDLVPPAPAVTSSDGRYEMWAVGEVFSPAATSLQGAEVRAGLLDTLLREGVDALARVNGEFQLALWDRLECSLLVAGDRFGCLPLYWVNTPEGFAFAGSVGALLRVPGVSADPDEQAIREAVTFGGFRLGGRTNVRSISMLGGARALSWCGGIVAERRYWSWPSAPPTATRRLDDLVDEAHALWQAAIRRRLNGATRPGNTLSGGLDSRAVMAEATAQGVSWRALTYGLPRCDDVRLARRAAVHAGAAWQFAPLYDAGWLERRTRFIPETDGLVQLADLLHFETFDTQTSMMDVHVCGYIGDAVCGNTYADVVDPMSLLHRLPYSGIPLAWTLDKALSWANEALAAVAPGAPRFAVFEHKLPQAIHRIFQAAQRRIRVRRPFLDLDLFDFYAGLDGDTRWRVYHTMLKRRYPNLFARIANQRTNAPVLSPDVQVQVRRVTRFAGRRVRDVVARTGIVRPAPVRSYHNEERYWREPSAQAQILATILRPGSISAEVFGRRPLESFLHDWFERGNGPAQTVGALYVFEDYHQSLAARSVGAAVAAI